MNRLSILLLAAVWLGRSSPLPAAAAAGAGSDDVVFQALGDELKRSMSMRLEDLEPPYFVQYAVDDTLSHRLTASYGALTSSNETHSRRLYSQLRVGSYTLDNSNFGGRSGGLLGVPADLPPEGDALALRQAIWRATDRQYKDALEILSQKRAYMKDRHVEDRPPDFTRTPPLTVTQEPLSGPFETARWVEYVRRISARFRTFAQIDDSDVALLSGVENDYLVNSEGSRLRYGAAEALLRISAEAQADDGERFAEQVSFFASTPEQFPPEAEVLAALVQLAERLGAVIRAPILEDYSGPVLFEGMAATQLFRQLLTRGILGQVDPIGSPRRNAAASEDLENRLGKRILPETFQIYDDPRPLKFENVFLAGHYEYDDEAVPAQRIDIVVNGKLEGMVMSRSPTKQFASSNGHGRRGGYTTPRSAVGSLYVESTRALSPEELKKELLRAVEGEGLKFGLRIEGIQSRASGPVGRGGVRGSARVVGDPISIHKVYVADGHEELVRGCEFTSLDIQNLRRTLAAGRVRTVQNNVIGTTPSSSIIAPAILIGEIELSRIKGETEKRPILPAPQARKTP